MSPNQRGTVRNVSSTAVVGSRAEMLYGNQWISGTAAAKRTAVCSAAAVPCSLVASAVTSAPLPVHARTVAMPWRRA